MIPNSIEYEVSLYVYGSDLDPGEVTSRLGLEPYAAGRRGEPRRGRQGQSYAPRKMGVWGYKISGTDLTQLLNHFLALLGQREQLLDGIPCAQEGHIEIVALRSDEDRDATCEMELTVEQVQKLSSYAVPLRITVI